MACPVSPLTTVASSEMQLEQCPFAVIDPWCHLRELLIVSFEGIVGLSAWTARDGRSNCRLVIQ